LYRFRNKARYLSKNVNFHTPFHLTYTTLDPLGVFHQNFNRLLDIPVHKLLDGAKILPKISNLEWSATLQMTNGRLMP